MGSHNDPALGKYIWCSLRVFRLSNWKITVTLTLSYNTQQEQHVLDLWPIMGPCYLHDQEQGPRTRVALIRLRTFKMSLRTGQSQGLTSLCTHLHWSFELTNGTYLYKCGLCRVSWVFCCSFFVIDLVGLLLVHCAKHQSTVYVIRVIRLLILRWTVWSKMKQWICRRELMTLI